MRDKSCERRAVISPRETPLGEQRAVGETVKTAGGVEGARGGRADPGATPAIRARNVLFRELIKRESSMGG